jgi:hypothetical protein
LGFEKTFHLIKRVLFALKSFGGHAIGGHHDLQTSHICVIGCVKDADVGGKPCKDDLFYSQMVEQDVQSRRIETPVLRFKNEIVFRPGTE